MQIPNPWPHHTLSRCTCKTPKGEVVMTSSTRGPLEVPDDTEEVVIEPVKFAGRGGKVDVLGQGRIWSKNWGLLDIEDHLKKVNLANEEAEMKARKAKEKPKPAKPKPKPKPAKPKEVKLEATSKLEMSDGMDGDGMYTGEQKCGGPISLDDPRNK
jgi:hypothetical protein